MKRETKNKIVSEKWILKKNPITNTKEKWKKKEKILEHCEEKWMKKKYIYNIENI